VLDTMMIAAFAPMLILRQRSAMPASFSSSASSSAISSRGSASSIECSKRPLGAPPPVAPRDPESPELHLASLSTGIVSGIVFFSLAMPAQPPGLGGLLPAYGGTLTTEIACNWKVCVEHLLAEHTPSPDFGWHWPLLAVRRAGAVTIMEQVVPHTFLRTRLLTHVFGSSPDDHKQSAATIKHVCEHLQADRNEGKPAIASPMVIAFHSRLVDAYAQDRATT